MAALEARVVISAEDRTGKAFDALKARIDGINKTVTVMNRAMSSVEPVARSVGAISKQIDSASGAMARMAKSSTAVTKFTRDLSEAEKKLKAIGDFRGASRSLDEVSVAFRRGQQEVRRLAAEVAAAEHPTKSLQAALAGAEADVSRLGAAFKAEGASVRFATDALAEAGVPLNRLRSEQDRLAASIERTSAAMRQQAMAERHAAEAADHVAIAERRAASAGQHGGTAHRTHGGVLGTVAEVGSLYGAFEAAEVAHRVIETYRDFDKERRYGQVVMGLTDEQQKPLVDQAIHGSAGSKFNDIQWLETQRELAARGYNKDQVLGFTPTVAQMGQAFDVSMPEAVKGLEGAMLSFRKDVSTPEKAEAAAKRTADLQVKASKISGMSFEDIVQLYKYGAAPAQMAHLSEESLLAFGAISKKSNMGGDESGVAFRALAKNLISPTAGARVAMRAAGIDFNKYQQTPDSLDTAGFTDIVAKKFGVALDANAQSQIDKLFHDKATFGDAAKFMPAMRDVLGDVLGGDDAKSKTKIAGLAGAYRDASMKGVDTNGLMAATIAAVAKNPALANSIFGSKQGGRIFAALGDPDVLNHILDELKNHSQGFAGNVSDARMAGFDGAMSRLQNSLKNVDTALGRAWDGGGSGGLLTDATSGLAHLTQAFAEASPVVQRSMTMVAAVGAIAGAMKGLGILKGGFGLNASAIALDEAAAHLMMVGGGPGGPLSKIPPAGIVPGGGALPGLAIPGGVTLGAATLFFGGAAVATEIVKKSFEAQQAGHGGLWAPATSATEASDRQDVADLKAERDKLAASVARQKAFEKIPGTSDASTYRDRARIADLNNAISAKLNSLDALHPKVLPANVPLPPERPLTGIPGIERRTLGNWIRSTRPSAEAGEMPAATPPPGAFDEGPRRGPNLSMAHAEPIQPHVDTSGIEAGKAAGGELQETLAAIAAMVVTPTVNPASLAAAAGMLKGIRADLEAINRGGTGGGTSGSVGTSYPQTSPTGRQGGPR